MTPRQAASCMGKIQKKWTSYREKYLENLEIQEGACTFAPQTLNMIERDTLDTQDGISRDSVKFWDG